MIVYKKVMLKVVAIIAFIIPNLALADYKSEIIDSCKTYQEGQDLSHVNACKLYIDGFIDASLLTDTGVVKPKAMIKEEKNKTTYLNRVYQTRLLTTSSMIKDEQAHEFCIPLEYNRAKIASSLAKSMDINQLNNKRLKEVLFDTLIVDFPCR